MAVTQCMLEEFVEALNDRLNREEKMLLVPTVYFFAKLEMNANEVVKSPPFLFFTAENCSPLA